MVTFNIGATENRRTHRGTLILSDSHGQHYHVLTGSFARWSSPGGLGVVNFPNNHFIGYTIDEDRQRRLVTVPNIERLAVV